MLSMNRSDVFSALGFQVTQSAFTNFQYYDVFIDTRSAWVVNMATGQEMSMYAMEFSDPIVFEDTMNNNYMDVQTYTWPAGVYLLDEVFALFNSTTNTFRLSLDSENYCELTRLNGDSVFRDRSIPNNSFFHVLGFEAVYYYGVDISIDTILTNQLGRASQPPNHNLGDSLSYRQVTFGLTRESNAGSSFSYPVVFYENGTDYPFNPTRWPITLRDFNQYHTGQIEIHDIRFGEKIYRCVFNKTDQDITFGQHYSDNSSSLDSPLLGNDEMNLNYNGNSVFVKRFTVSCFDTETRNNRQDILLNPFMRFVSSPIKVVCEDKVLYVTTDTLLLEIEQRLKDVSSKIVSFRPNATIAEIEMGTSINYETTSTPILFETTEQITLQSTSNEFFYRLGFSTYKYVPPLYVFTALRRVFPLKYYHMELEGMDTYTISETIDLYQDDRLVWTIPLGNYTTPYNHLFSFHDDFVSTNTLLVRQEFSHNNQSYFTLNNPTHTFQVLHTSQPFLTLFQIPSNVGVWNPSRQRYEIRLPKFTSLVFPFSEPSVLLPNFETPETVTFYREYSVLEWEPEAHIIYYDFEFVMTHRVMYTVQLLDSPYFFFNRQTNRINAQRPFTTSSYHYNEIYIEPTDFWVRRMLGFSENASSLTASYPPNYQSIYIDSPTELSFLGNTQTISPSRFQGISELLPFQQRFIETFLIHFYSNSTSTPLIISLSNTSLLQQLYLTPLATANGSSWEVSIPPYSTLLLRSQRGTDYVPRIEPTPSYEHSIVLSVNDSTLTLTPSQFFSEYLFGFLSEFTNLHFGIHPRTNRAFIGFIAYSPPSETETLLLHVNDRRFFDLLGFIVPQFTLLSDNTATLPLTFPTPVSSTHPVHAILLDQELSSSISTNEFTLLSETIYTQLSIEEFTLLSESLSTQSFESLLSTETFLSETLSTDAFLDLLSAEAFLSVELSVATYWESVEEQYIILSAETFDEWALDRNALARSSRSTPLYLETIKSTNTFSDEQLQLYTHSILLRNVLFDTENEWDDPDNAWIVHGNLRVTGQWLLNEWNAPLALAFNVTSGLQRIPSDDWIQFVRNSTIKLTYGTDIVHVTNATLLLPTQGVGFLLSPFSGMVLGNGELVFRFDDEPTLRVSASSIRSIGKPLLLPPDIRQFASASFGALYDTPTQTFQIGGMGCGSDGVHLTTDIRTPSLYFFNAMFDAVPPDVFITQNFASTPITWFPFPVYGFGNWEEKTVNIPITLNKSNLVVRITYIISFGMGRTFFASDFISRTSAKNLRTNQTLTSFDINRRYYEYPVSFLTIYETRNLDTSSILDGDTIQCKLEIYLSNGYQFRITSPDLQFTVQIESLQATETLFSILSPDDTPDQLVFSETKVNRLLTLTPLSNTTLHQPLRLVGITNYLDFRPHTSETTLNHDLSLHPQISRLIPRLRIDAPLTLGNAVTLDKNGLRRDQNPLIATNILLDILSVRLGTAPLHLSPHGLTSIDSSLVFRDANDSGWRYSSADQKVSLRVHPAEYHFFADGIATATNWLSTSDSRLKHRFAPYPNDVTLPTPISFEWKTDPSQRRYIGFLADDAETLPHAVFSVPTTQTGIVQETRIYLDDTSTFRDNSFVYLSGVRVHVIHVESTHLELDTPPPFPRHARVVVHTKTIDLMAMLAAYTRSLQHLQRRIDVLSHRIH